MIQSLAASPFLLPHCLCILLHSCVLIPHFFRREMLKALIRIKPLPKKMAVIFHESAPNKRCRWVTVLPSSSDAAHVLQSLDVGTLAPVGRYFSQEVDD